MLPLVGIGVAIASLPIAWVCYRTRAATFAIVTITLLFMTQQLAYNLHSLTNGSQGIAIPTPNFPVATYEVPYYYAMLGVLALSMLASWFVRGSKLGLALFSIRDDEDRAAGLGVQTEFAKLRRSRCRQASSPWSAASGRTTSPSSIRSSPSTRSSRSGWC